MKVLVGVSNRHIHLCREDFDLLFSSDLSKRNDLYQPNEFASNLVVSIENDNKRIDNVRVLGPLRSYTQVEISKTDAYYLGVNPPIASSGDLSLASDITISTNKNKIVRKCCIIANRHIHISKEERVKYNLNKEVYKVKVANEKGGILDNVYLKEGNYKLQLHLDRDDANANLIKSGDLLELIE